MSNTRALVKLGQFMMNTAGNFKCDVTFNQWARVGQALTELDSLFAPRLREFPEEDQQLVRAAADVMLGKSEMPELLVPRETTPRRKRRARMTRAMGKREDGASPKAAKQPKAPKVVQPADATAPRKRGRPRKVVA
jgi:hypothetical protein